MGHPEPLDGDALWAFQNMARALGRTLEPLDDQAVAEVVSNYTFRVAVHGVETAIREHQVPSVLARAIGGGLFHAQAVLRGRAKGGTHG